MNNSVFSAKLIKPLRELHNSGIIISPWLAGVGGTDRFDPGVFEFLDLRAKELAIGHWNEAERIANFGTLPMSDEFPATAVYEITASTAVLIAHEQKGDLLVDETIAAEALKRVSKFIDQYGIGTLLQLYQLVSAYDNLNALHYYGSIPEREFLLGTRHRPWIDYTLQNDLLTIVLLQVAEIVIKDTQRHVQLTPSGCERLKFITNLLEQTDFFKFRTRILHVSQFNLFSEYETLTEELIPVSATRRKTLIELAGIKPGMQVLELGCGSGPLTFEAGLADRIGPKGHLTCVDPSAGMLRRAKQKPEATEKNWVEFRQGKAEFLPFDDNSFDAVIGAAFFQFCDREIALREIRRVLRPGGTVAFFHPLAYNVTTIPFFRKWFIPVFRLAAKHAGKPKNTLFTAEEGLRSFELAGLSNIESQMSDLPFLFHDPKKVVKHFIHGIGMFQEELAALPWKAREEVMEQLENQGHIVCRQYSDQERIVYWPMQFIRGVAP